jgi:hypothetical protein
MVREELLVRPDYPWGVKQYRKLSLLIGAGLVDIFGDTTEKEHRRDRAQARCTEKD